MKWFCTKEMVSADLPTPPVPTTTILNSFDIAAAASFEGILAGLPVGPGGVGFDGGGLDGVGAGFGVSFLRALLLLFGEEE